MPTTKSAEKRLRQNVKRNLRNKIHKSALRGQIKKFLGSLKEGNIQTTEEELRLTVKKLDKSVSRGILHKKAASRKKSRLMKKLSQTQTALQQKK
ncbi:MAG: 30S ribosomal protein S20 [Candidatus Loosdrechtia sp.]|uniref:30S ribosomal protein S20 n=1 Tax=Candidatus Loosdrechtia sp. TaxID=3101272 RepID=UPI003A79EDE6|nr:MAG: 30S ribosomal protein S20 [Candidatus Jettenia sp. AMX2]